MTRALLLFFAAAGASSAAALAGCSILIGVAGDPVVVDDPESGVDAAFVLEASSVDETAAPEAGQADSGDIDGGDDAGDGAVE